MQGFTQIGIQFLLNILATVSLTASARLFSTIKRFVKKLEMSV
jgi:hypothetical protein